MSTNGYTILLVEDEPNDIFLFERAFKKLDLSGNLQVVSDGEAAISYLTGEGEYADRERFPIPSLVLLDLKLPRISGLEILSWLRQQPGLRRLLVVVLSSSKETIDINRAYDLGANSYLVKPVAFGTLVNIVKTLDLYWLAFNERPEIPG
jgi:CheY-like chemotaxis protein